MDEQVVEVLRAARELIAVPERWTKRVWGRFEDGGAGLFSEPGLVCYCPDGAICRAGLELGTREGALATARNFVGAFVPGGAGPNIIRLWDFNDAPQTTHAEVLRVFDEAIAALEEAAK